MAVIPTGWVEMEYLATNFTAETGSWNVSAADVNFLRFKVIDGSTVMIRISVNDTAITDPTAKLFYQLPAWMKSIGHSPDLKGMYHQAAVPRVPFWVEMEEGTGLIECRRLADLDFAAGNTGFSLHFWFELQNRKE